MNKRVMGGCAPQWRLQKDKTSTPDPNPNASSEGIANGGAAGALNPQPLTRNLNPQPSTLNPRPSKVSRMAGQQVAYGQGLTLKPKP